MRNRYPALAFVAGFIKVIGWVVAVVGIIGAIIVAIVCLALPTRLGLLGVGAAAISLPVSVLAGVGIVAHGEWIELHLELVANSRPPTTETFADEPLDWAA